MTRFQEQLDEQAKALARARMENQTLKQELAATRQHQDGEQVSDFLIEDLRTRLAQVSPLRGKPPGHPAARVA
jgi:hypothetical protein